MLKIITLNEKTGLEEYFYISSTMCIEEFEESLKFIRNQSHGNWFRSKRILKEVTSNFSLPSIRMKYIVTLRDDTDQEEIIVFNTNIHHDCMFEVLRMGNKEIFRDILSAGFTDGISCFERSETLNINSRPEMDSLLLGI